MTWLAPISLFPDTSGPISPGWPVPLPARRSAAISGGAPGMASATAGPGWRWAGPASALRSDTPLEVEAAISLPAPQPARVRIPVDLLRRMSFEARLSGVSESDVWAEAARAWLRRRARDDDFPPTPPAAAQPCPRRERTAWVAIDALLVALRARPSEPAAA
jgi:hypothetical protein